MAGTQASSEPTFKGILEGTGASTGAFNDKPDTGTPNEFIGKITAGKFKGQFVGRHRGGDLEVTFKGTFEGAFDGKLTGKSSSKLKGAFKERKENKLTGTFEGDFNGTFKKNNLPLRIIRCLAGILGLSSILLLILNSIVLPWWLTPKTNDAWINAPLVSIRADYEGSVIIEKKIGDTVGEGTVLGRMTNGFFNQAAVLRLRADRANLEAEVKRVRDELKVATSLKEISEAELEKYRESLVISLKHSLRQSEARLEGALVSLSRSERLLKLNTPLQQNNLIGPDSYANFQENKEMAFYAAEEARALRDIITNELHSAEGNVFIERDSPIYLTHSLQIRLTVPQLAAKVAELESRLVSQKVDLEAEEALAEHLQSSLIKSPVSGIVWRRNVTSGTVGRGELLMEIAQSPAHQALEAQFPEAQAKRLFPGARAVILIHGCQPAFGILRAVRQPSPADLESSTAIRLPRQLNQVRAYIDCEDIAKDQTVLGRQCRVLILGPASGTGQSEGKAAIDWLAKTLFTLFGF